MKKKYSENQYFIYLIVLILLLAIYPTLKSLLDAGILMSTGRIINTDDWLELIFLEKENITLEASTERRILIISGSSGLFGISAKEISRQTGIKAINLSSHAGLGGEYILTRSKPFIREDDIVLLSLEYAFYMSSGISNDFEKGSVASRFITTYDRQRLQDISGISILRFIINNSLSINARREYVAFFKGQLSRKDILERLRHQKENGDCYSGLTLNEYGDETCNIGKESRLTNPVLYTTTMPPSLTVIDPGGYIKSFVEYAERKGATVVPIYPTTVYTIDYEKSEFQLSSESIELFWNNQGIVFRDSLKDSLLPPKMMYDTHYHANDFGREKRTRNIVNLLRKYLEKGEPEVVNK